MKNFMLAALVVLPCLFGCASVNPDMQPTDQSTDLSDGCHSPLGFIPEGHSANGYLHQIEQHGQSCQRGTLTCEDGVWSGAYIYPSCVRSAN